MDELKIIRERSGKVVTLTENAVVKYKELTSKNNKENFGLKFYVFPGGCSGYKYGMDFVEKAGENDIIYEERGIKIFIDKDSVPLLSGVKIDYLDTLQNSGFKISNPNSKGTCGCGSSFH